MSTRARSLIPACVAAALLCLAPGAGAATLDRAPDGVLVYSGGAAGVKLDVQAGYDGRSAVFYGSSLDPVTSYPADCAGQYDDSVITCAKPPAVRVDLGDGDDHGQVSADVGFPVTIAGGPGRDWLEGNGAANTLDGGPGDDKVTGSGGDDVLSGGDGNDQVEGGAGSDVLSGGAGDDLLRPDGNEDPSADTVDGGPGRDTIDQDYSSRFASGVSAVAITLAGGADDGRPGEGDDLRGIERVVLRTPGTVTGTDGPDEIAFSEVGEDSVVTGGAGDDSLRAGDGADRLDGGAGNDAIDGGFGDDTITGGPGRDVISADLAGGDCGPKWCKLPYGNDTIHVRDGEVDSVTCGAGTDRVEADAADVIAPDCEQVDRAGGAGAVAGAGAGNGSSAAVRLAAGAWPRLRSALARGLTLRLTGVRAGRITLVARDGQRVVATGSGRATAGTVTVRLRFSSAARRRLAHRAKLRIAITGGGLRANVTLRR